MATEDDVRRLALALPGVRELTHYAIAGKPIAWPYFERDKSRRNFTFHAGVMAIRCPLPEKEMLIEAAPNIYFDDDYHRTFPAVLVRLDRIDPDELAAMLARANSRPPSRGSASRDGGAAGASCVAPRGPGFAQVAWRFQFLSSRCPQISILTM